tara:strand:- start:874 stop:1320 length:447 start_codon:yes stop_codon:yes gene_type:complete
MKKSSEDHQNNSRLGALGELLVQAFLIQYCDFVYPTQDKHKADIMCELSNAKYTVQVKSRRETKEGKYVFAAEPSRSMSSVYKNYHVDILAFVFFGKQHKRIFFKANTSTQNYYTFQNNNITDTMELDSFQECLNQLNQIPVLNPLFK